MPVTTGLRLGRYRLGKRLGMGGMAEVWEAFDEELHRTVAVKVILDLVSHDPSFAERFTREARLVAALDHPNILPVYDFGREGETTYLVMPLVSGGTLKDKAETPQPIAAIISWISGVASALDYAHAKGILHRDVKPGNVLLDVSGRALLADFGLAKVAASMAGLTAKGALMGTPHYMSPEQALGNPLDGRSDQYALGVMAFQLLTGTLPFDADTPLGVLHQHMEKPSPLASRTNPRLPPGMDTVLATALAKSPDARYASCEAFARALADAAVKAKGEEEDTEVVTKSRRGPLVLSKAGRYGVLAAGAMLVAALGAVLVHQIASRPPAGGISRLPSPPEPHPRPTPAPPPSPTAAPEPTRPPPTAPAPTATAEGPSPLRGEVSAVPTRRPRSPDASLPETIRQAGRQAVSDGRIRDAEPLLRRALAEFERQDPDGREVARTLEDLALVLARLGREAEAEPLLLRSLSLLEKRPDADPVEVADRLQKLAWLRRRQRRDTEAEGLYERALRIKEKARGPNDRSVASALLGLGWCRTTKREFVEAEPLFRRALAILDTPANQEDRELGHALDATGRLYEAERKTDEAEPLLERALAIREKALGPNNPEVAQTLHALARISIQRMQWAKAEPGLRRALAIREATLGPDHPLVARTLFDLANVLQHMRRGAEAKELRRRAKEIRQEGEEGEAVDEEG